MCVLFRMIYVPNENFQSIHSLSFIYFFSPSIFKSKFKIFDSVFLSVFLFIFILQLFKIAVYFHYFTHLLEHRHVVLNNQRANDKRKSLSKTKTNLNRFDQSKLIKYRVHKPNKCEHWLKVAVHVLYIYFLYKNLLKQ